jgi:hypothetical protein
MLKLFVEWRYFKMALLITLGVFVAGINNDADNHVKGKYKGRYLGQK